MTGLNEQLVMVSLPLSCHSGGLPPSQDPVSRQWRFLGTC